MDKFELQKSVSQLLNALKSQLFACELFSDRLFQTNKKSPYFQPNHFCDIITSELFSFSELKHS